MKLENMSTPQLLLEALERIEAVMHQLNERKKYYTRTDYEKVERIETKVEVLTTTQTAIKAMLHAEIDAEE